MHVIVLMFSVVLIRDNVLMTYVILMYRVMLASGVLSICANMLICNVVLGLVSC